MPTTDPITLVQAIAYFDEAEELSLSARNMAEKCRDYYDHRQYTADEIATLRRRKQPVITRNRVKPKVDFLKGIEVSSRTEPEATPREPGDDNAAQIATDAVRYVYAGNKFDKVKSDVFENLAIEGSGGVEVYCKPGRKPGEFEICIKRYQWDRLGWDPHSREKDFSDTVYRYAVAWMDYEQAVDRYGDHQEIIDSTLSREGSMSTTYDDAPRLRWAEVKRRRIRVVKLEYLHHGGVWVCEFTRGGFLVDPEPSPYLDEAGVPEWSIILQSVHVDREGNRYGPVKCWLDIQDEINKRASKYLHIVSQRQTYANNKAQGEDTQKLKFELAKPDGHLQFDAGEYGKDFGILPTMDMAEAQFRLLQEAKQEIDSVGVHAALSGDESRDLSGKALGKLQQGASAELKPLFEAIAQFDNQVSRTVWNRIKQFWKAEKWIRVTGDEDAPKWIGLNVPVTMGDHVAGQNGGQVPAHLNGDPRLEVVVGVSNNLAEIDVDFTMVEVPDVVNAMQEQFEAITTIFPAIPDEMKPAAFEMLVESSRLRNKKKFLERLRGDGEGDGNKLGAQLQELMAELQRAKIGQIQAQTEKTRAETKVKMVETIYSSLQAAGVAISMRDAANVADSILGSVGFEDQDPAPVVPVPTAYEGQPGIPVIPRVPVGPGNQVTRENTDPRYPAQPIGPGAGMMHGIETQQNDGTPAREMGRQ
jgi:hypothetical protein